MLGTIPLSCGENSRFELPGTDCLVGDELMLSGLAVVGRCTRLCSMRRYVDTGYGTGDENKNDDGKAVFQLQFR